MTGRGAGSGQRAPSQSSLVTTRTSYGILAKRHLNVMGRYMMSIHILKDYCLLIVSVENYSDYHEHRNLTYF